MHDFMGVWIAFVPFTLVDVAACVSDSTIPEWSVSDDPRRTRVRRWLSLLRGQAWAFYGVRAFKRHVLNLGARTFAPG